VLFFIFFYLVTILCGVVLFQIMHLANSSVAINPAAMTSYIEKNLWVSVVITFTGALLTTSVFRRFVDRRSFASLGFAWAGFQKHAWAGFFTAIAMLGIGTIVLSLTHILNFTGVQVDVEYVIINLGLMLFVAIGEELVFRGYILNNLMESTDKWIALLVSAVLFALVHSANPGANILPILEVFLGGLMLGINYIYTKNLWFSIFLHFAWNFFQGPVLGYKVSGMELEPMVQQNINGPEWLTGGAFGFEGSILSMVLSIIVVVWLARVYEKKGLAPGSN